MRISWLEPEVAERIRTVLSAWNGDWAAHFTPEFQIPPPPPGMTGKHWPAGRWARAAEHVARTERVAQTVRAEGVPIALERYSDSPHAVEVATLFTLAAARPEPDSIEPDLVITVLRCAIDGLLVYGPFLQLLEQIAMVDERGHEPALSVYREFCTEFAANGDDGPMWRERVGAARDGLAGFYVRCGHLDEGHALFSERHEEETDGILVALAASRVFLTAGALAQTVTWLKLGADRAQALGRDGVAAKLRAKRDRIRARM